ncbi:MAG: response regulator [Spirochaetaceae bacterium]|jgi:DNA-binding NtrC family response regulator|nr:response regulator [Spirochaetaceae bacterium]
MTEKFKNTKCTILAIDDSPEILTLINEILGETYNIHLAKTVKAANIILNEKKADMILLDLKLEGDISGLDFLSYLKSRDSLKDIPVLMISSNSQLMNVSKATKLGARGYIVKPINAVNLRDKIYSILLETKYSGSR